MWINHNTIHGFNVFSGLKTTFHWVLYLRFNINAWLCMLLLLSVSTGLPASLTCRKLIEIKKYYFLSIIRIQFSCFVWNLNVKIFLQSITLCLYIVTMILMNKNVQICLVFWCFVLLFSFFPEPERRTGLLKEIHQRATTVKVLLRLVSSLRSRHLLP